MFSFTDNPEKDAERFYAEQEKRLQDLPTCTICGEPIQDDYAYDIGFSEYVHEDCIEKLRKRIN